MAITDSVENSGAEVIFLISLSYDVFERLKITLIDIEKLERGTGVLSLI